MRILQCSDAYLPHPSGVAEHIYHLSNALRKRGHEVYILAPHYPSEKNMPYVKRVGRVFYVNGNGSTITLTRGKRLLKDVKGYLHRMKFDIVHTHGPMPFNLPYIAFHYATAAVNVATFHSAFSGFNPFSILRFIHYKEFKRKMHGVIYVSETAKDNHFRFFYPSYYTIVPNGIDTDRFNPKVAPIKAYKDRDIILFVGRLDKRKGLKRLINVFPELKKKFPKIKLVVVGEGVRESYLDSLPWRLRKDVVFTGYVSREDLPSYYRSAKIFISPSYGSETFGIVLLEAMASEVPVIASDIPGYRNVIENNVNGLLFKTEKEMISSIVSLLTNKTLRDRLVKNALKTAEAYSWDSIAARVEAFYTLLRKKHLNSYDH